MDGGREAGMQRRPTLLVAHSLRGLDRDCPADYGLQGMPAGLGKD
jgi:hypothetical protein